MRCVLIGHLLAIGKFWETEKSSDSCPGPGIGRRLVEECVRFARQARYLRLTLWTNDILATARHLYERAGFRLAKEEHHHSFGHDLVGQHWTLKL